MKYLLVLIVVIAAISIWRSKRRVETPKRPTAAPASAPRQLQNMLSCAHCGLHFPQSDAIMGANAQPYCCVEHRDAARNSTHER